jgi:hypothetical protein
MPLLATRLVGYLALLSAGAADKRLFQPDVPFWWATYRDDQGRRFTSPRWAEGKPGPNEGDFVTLVSAEGVLRLPRDWVIHRVRLEVYRPSPANPGAWEGPPPAIEIEARLGAYDPRAGGWPVSAAPKAAPPARFPTGFQVKCQWYFAYTDPDGKTGEAVIDTYPTAENVRPRPRK